MTAQASDKGEDDEEKDWDDGRYKNSYKTVELASCSWFRGHDGNLSSNQETESDIIPGESNRVREMREETNSGEEAVLYLSRRR